MPRPSILPFSEESRSQGVHSSIIPIGSWCFPLHPQEVPYLPLQLLRHQYSRTQTIIQREAMVHYASVAGILFIRFSWRGLRHDADWNIASLRERLLHQRQVRQISVFAALRPN